MNRQKFLRQVRSEIHFIFERRQIEQELNDHLNDSKADLMEEGLCEEEAEMQAVAQMGDPKEVGKLLNKEHHPILGYIWSVSIAIVIATAILAMDVGYDSLQSALDVLYPTKSIGYRIEESYPVHLKFETRTHHVVIDHICYTDTADYYITYRAKTKFEYLRAIPYWPVFEVGYHSPEAEGAEWSHSISEGQFGEKGYVMFDWPEDDILYLHGTNGEVVELDLGEYWK